MWGPADKAKQCIERGKKLEAELDARIYEQVKELQSKCKAKKKTNNSTDQISDIKTPDTASIAKTKTPKTKIGKGKGEFEFEYIGLIGQDKPCAMGGNCVLIDPGRRDLLFCMHEYSSVGNP
ncbi:hypothetical protein IW140_004252 [Coemansia sp. RSA 1813]|nr:hypothetical protein LPJ74_003152 [Coemansia sp. RSA 1843]KAJ2568007.1 hypothetical protein IW140_004252 [Coemansia sp. RSA 1813]